MSGDLYEGSGFMLSQNIIFAMQYLLFFLVCNNLTEEERAGCITLIVFLMSWDY